MGSLRRAQICALVCCLLVPVLAAAKDKSSVSFRAPVREYVTVRGEFNILIERRLTTGNPALSKRALRKLEQTLQEVFSKLPAYPGQQLHGLKFYLMWGEDSPDGGMPSGMSYIREGEPRNYPHLDPRWNNVIVVYSAKNLMWLDGVWAKKALAHELAHAWHLTHWPDRHPPIYTAFQSARGGGLYRGVKDYKDKEIAEAYAVHNQLEYFAELSAMYFVGGNYFPFDRAGLAKYDPVGERMVRSLWGP